VVLELLGRPHAAAIAILAGLNTSLADAGGPYRTRLLAMGLVANNTSPVLASLLSTVIDGVVGLYSAAG
jgi:hypothetical protein